MPNYQFTSPAAAFSDAIEQALMQREVLKRQALLDSLTQKRTDAEIAGAEATRGLQRDQFAYTQRRDVAEDDFRSNQARQAAADRAAAAEAQREFQRGENDLNRQSRAEQAQHDRELRELIARMGASNSAESRALANQLREVQIQTSQDKLDATRADRGKTEQAAKQGRQEVYGLANELLNDPAMSRAAGPLDAYMPTVRPGTKDFENRLSRLKNLLTFENRSKLKGQGAISDAETRMLEQSASAIDLAAGEDNVKRELKRIMTATGVAPAAGTDTVEEWTRDSTGRLVRKR
jgi:hypothetical protein